MTNKLSLLSFITLLFSSYEFATSATLKQSNLRGKALRRRMYETVTKNTVCHGADGNCITETCFAISNGETTYSAKLLSKTSIHQQGIGKHIVFYMGDDCFEENMIGKTSEDDAGVVESILRMGMTEDLTADGSKYTPYVIAEKYDNNHRQNDEDTSINAVASLYRKLDDTTSNIGGKYIVIVPNFRMNVGPISKDNHQCVTGETTVGTSIVQAFDDDDQIDSYELWFNDLPIRSQCGSDDQWEKYCHCEDQKTR